MYEVFFKFYSCNEDEDIKPSAAFSCGHIKYKVHAQECTKTRHFYFKNFLGSGTAPSPDPSPAGGGHLLLHSPSSAPVAAWRLDLRAFGAPHSEVWLRACIKH